MVPLLVILTIVLFLALDASVRYARSRHLAKTKPAPDAMWNPGLGWTFADGGEHVEKEEEETK